MYITYFSAACLLTEYGLLGACGVSSRLGKGPLPKVSDVEANKKCLKCGTSRKQASARFTVPVEIRVQHLVGMVVAVRHGADRRQMENHFGLHFANRALHGELVAQIAKDDLHAVVRAQNVAPGHVSLHGVEIVPAHFRETFQ